MGRLRALNHSALPSPAYQIFVVWVTWAALTLKQRVVEVLEEHLRSRRDAASEGIVLLLRPVSGVLTALILLLSTLGTLRAFGVDIAALLAATGSLGLVAALATQSLCANLAAALAIYAGRPFVVGDRVQLRQASSVVAEVRERAATLPRHLSTLWQVKRCVRNAPESPCRALLWRLNQCEPSCVTTTATQVRAELQQRACHMGCSMPCRPWSSPDFRHISTFAAPPPAAVYVNNSQVINLILTNLTQGTSYQSRHIDG